MSRKFLRGALVVAALTVSAAASGHAATLSSAPGLFFEKSAPPAAPACDPASTINLPGGSTVCGIQSTSRIPPNGQSPIVVYEGIRYGRAQRWANPVAETWPPQGALSAVSFGNVCPQSLPSWSTATASEDCLFLNVWAPQSAINGAQKLPVMVFIHGGAFVSGAGSDGTYDGTALASRGVIVVTLNYRLGALGFLVGRRYGIDAVGNYGLRDQQLAMKWVHDNIAQFGGDNSRITLFGESAGAMSVGLHTFDVPTSAPLFANALMESNPMTVVYRTTAGARRMGNEFLDFLCRYYSPDTANTRCNVSAAWLKKVPPGVIVTAQNEFLTGTAMVPYVIFGVVSTKGLPWAPVVDPSGAKTPPFVTGQPFNGYAATMPAKPIAFGINRNEGVLFAALSNVALVKNPADYSSHPTHKFYSGLLTKNYHAGVFRIGLYSAYRTRDQIGYSYYSKSGSALANVLEDGEFACGNLVAVNNALAASKGVPAYAYYFSQAPFYDAYNLHNAPNPPDLGACMPSTGNVCHANELPYVFDTLWLIEQIAPQYKPATSDQPLADAMNAAWAAYAQDPQSPGKPWISYAPGGNATQLNGVSDPQVNLDSMSNCSKLWAHLAPFN